MTYDSIIEFLSRVTKDNEEAKQFLIAWYHYLHCIDDVVDGDKGPANTITVARWANDIYNFPFYLKHVATLRPIVQLITITYEDSVQMERSGIKWQEDAADVLRHCGADMIRVVAWIVGGYNHAKQISMELRESCYLDHHTESGERI